MTTRATILCHTICSLLLLLVTEASLSATLDELLAQIKLVDRHGHGNTIAAQAWRELANSDAQQLPSILAALDDANPLAANWIRSCVDAIAERKLADGGELPLSELEKFTLDVNHSPRARRTAFEWLSRADETAAERLIPGLLHDPSVEFRRDAVARLLQQATRQKDSSEGEAARATYLEALGGARDLDQIQLISAELKKLGHEVDLVRHFGFLARWQLIGPFDNTDGVGFAAVYPPEKAVELDAQHAGKAGARLGWVKHETTNAMGKVDLNQALGKAMGVCAYAYYEFDAAESTLAEFRWGSANATKIWVNGKLLGEFEAYHTGAGVDQYSVRAKISAGRNQILLKVCQNEQTEDWAQVWEFQLRVCDSAGTPIYSKESLAQVSSSAAAR